MYPKKVLLIRFSSIGDIVLTSAVIRCIKEQIGCELHYLTKPGFRSLLESNPHIDKIHTLKDELKDTIIDLQSEDFDLVVDLHKSLRSRRISRAMAVKTIKFQKLNIRKYAFTRLKWRVLPNIHLVDRYFQSLESIGVANDNKGLEYYSGKDAIVDLEAIGVRAPYDVYAIGGTYVTKRLPEEQIIELLSGLKRPCLLLGGPDDEALGQRIAEQFQPDKVINLCGSLSFNQSAWLIERATNVICHDSGMMHIASAYNKPLQVIWGNTHPLLGMYPYQVKHVRNYGVELKCRPCSKLGYGECPKKHFNCMKMQNVGEIVKNCNSVESEQ